MLRWLFALLLIPFLDAVLLAFVFSQTDAYGWGAMILLVVLTGLIGMLLVRAEGRRTIRKMQRSIAQGEPPTNQLLDGALLIAAGAFLLTPGLVTDALGLALVIPLTRIPIRVALKRFVIVPYADKKADGFVSGNVWTIGFPQGESVSGATRGANADSSSDSSRSSNNTYDLSENAYTVDSATEDDDSYTIEFGDEGTWDDDEWDDDPNAR